MKEIRVLLLNGSPRANGNTALALREMEKAFAQNGVQTETVLLGNQAIRGCTACGACAKLGRCVFDDAVNELAPKLEAADGLVVASPVYYASANATLIACLDRLFYSTPFDKTMKVGASATRCIAPKLRSWYCAMTRSESFMISSTVCTTLSGGRPPSFLLRSMLPREAYIRMPRSSAAATCASSSPSACPCGKT